MNVAASGDSKVGRNPDLGLSDAERMAAHAANSAAFWKRYAAWVREVGPELDLGAIRVGESLALTAGPAASLVEAVDLAELIISGTVRNVEFLPTADSRASIAVDAIVKGQSAAVVRVASPCMLQPKEDWTIDSIGCAGGMPMLYPDDRVVLLLLDSGLGDGTFAVQPWTGTYWIREDGVHSVEGNPWAAAVDQKSLAELLTAMRSIAR